MDYDAARDFQTGEARATASDRTGSEVQMNLAAALDAGSAKALAQTSITRTWAQRDTLTLRLPPKRLAMEPGSRVTLPLAPSDWTVSRVTIDAFVIVAEMHPSLVNGSPIAADGGRVAPTLDVIAGPLSLALFDVPNVLGLASPSPTIFLAATSPTPGWKSEAIAVSFSGQDLVTQTARTKSVLGDSRTILAAGDAGLIDEINTVDVALVDQTQWLTSCDDDALAAGQNLAMLGSEVFQFGQATPLGGGQFRLSRLLRGRGGTEWACANHVAGELFCLLDAGTLQSVTLPSWAIGATLSAASGSGASASLDYVGDGVRPLCPIDLVVRTESDRGLLLTWIRRSRQGFAWIDGIDVPIGESVEQYRVTLSGGTSFVEITTGQPSATVDTSVLATLGPGPVAIEVRQIGDFAVSRPAQTSITLS